VRAVSGAPRHATREGRACLAHGGKGRSGIGQLRPECLNSSLRLVPGQLKRLHGSSMGRTRMRQGIGRPRLYSEEGGSMGVALLCQVVCGTRLQCLHCSGVVCMLVRQGFSCPRLHVPQSGCVGRLLVGRRRHPCL
jgi:hypothetical protein